MDDHPYYLRQRPNAFPVVPVSTLSALIASSDIVGSRLSTVADLAGALAEFPTCNNQTHAVKRERHFYLRQGGYVFAGVCLSVCVCVQDNSKSYVRIFLQF